jgi:serine/threonine-protein kinase RsbW
MMFYSQLNLQSELSELSETEAFLEDLMQQLGIEDAFFGVLSIPLNECVKNAIVHGNRCDKSKKVLIEVQIKKSELLFSITDQGSGFDYEFVQQKRFEQQTQNGLMMVELLTENLQFSKNGTQVSYTVDIPFSFCANDKRIDVLQQSRPVSKKKHIQI